jgi:ankyrin repeat protein
LTAAEYQRISAELDLMSAHEADAPTPDPLVEWLVMGAGSSTKLKPDAALHRAASTGDLKGVQTAIEAGANPNSLDDYGRTPLHCAASAGQSTVIRALVAAGANTENASRSGFTPLMLAANTGEVAVLEALIAAGARTDDYLRVGQGGECRVIAQTPCTLAAIQGHTPVVELLLATGVNIEDKDELGGTALLNAAYCGHLELTCLLLDAGASLNIRDEKESSPLMHTVRLGHAAITRRLLHAGARLDAPAHEDAWGQFWREFGRYLSVSADAEFEAQWAEIALNNHNATAVMYLLASGNIPVVREEGC